MSHAALRSLPTIEDLLYRYASEGTAHAADRHAGTLRELSEPLAVSDLPVFAHLSERLGALASEGTPSALLEAAALAGLSGSALPTAKVTPDLVSVIPAPKPPDRHTASYRALLLAREALTGHRADRQEILHSYGKNGVDFRLAPYLVEALCDSEPDIRLLCRQWLQELGPVAAPLLIATMDIRRANALDTRKASLAASSLGEHSLDFCRDCYHNGGKAVRSAVLDALVEFGGDEGLQLVTDALSNQERMVRESAFRAMSRYGGEQAVAALEQAVATDCRAALSALSAMPCVAAGQALLRLGDAMAYGDARHLDSLAEALGRRKDKTRQDFRFLCAQLERLQAGVFPGEWEMPLEIALTQALASWNNAEALDVLESFLPQAQTPAVIVEAALRLRTPEDFYERYGLLADAKIAATVRSLLRNLYVCDESPVLDKRWNEMFCRNDDGLMAALTAEPGMDGAISFLRRFQYCDDLTPAENLHLLYCVYPQTLLRIGAKDFYRDMLDSLESLLREHPPNSGFPWRHLCGRASAEAFCLGGPDTAQHLRRLSDVYPHEALRELCDICDTVCEGWDEWKS